MAQQVKDLVSLLWLRSLLWRRFDPWPGNFRRPHGCSKKKKEEEEKRKGEAQAELDKNANTHMGVDTEQPLVGRVMK